MPITREGSRVLQQGERRAVARAALAVKFSLCSYQYIMRIDPTIIASSLLTAPDRVRVGLTSAVERLREDAANELARAIVEQIEADASGRPDPNQLWLAL